MRPAPISAAILTALALNAGCAQPGPLVNRQATLGTLKTSVGRLENENEQLRRQVATLEKDRRRIGDQLAQEEELNDELATKLDDARSAARTTGETVASPARADGNETARSRRTTPSGRSSKPARKPPFARIPGRIDSGASEDLELPPGEAPRDDVGPQSFLDRSSTRWLPLDGPPAARR